jgi:hypothetical protein
MQILLSEHAFNILFENKTQVLYHGTNELFEVPRIISVHREVGFHLGTYNQALKIFGEDKPKYINKYEVHVKNPLGLKDLVHWTPESYEVALWKSGIDVKQSASFLGNKRATANDIINALHENGYDSVVYYNEYEGYGDSLIIFDANQVRFIRREVL